MNLLLSASLTSVHIRVCCVCLCARACVPTPPNYLTLPDLYLINTLRMWRCSGSVSWLRPLCVINTGRREPLSVRYHAQGLSLVPPSFLTPPTLQELTEEVVGSPIPEPRQRSRLFRSQSESSDEVSELDLSHGKKDAFVLEVLIVRIVGWIHTLLLKIICGTMSFFFYYFIF